MKKSNKLFWSCKWPGRLKLLEHSAKIEKKHMLFATRYALLYILGLGKFHVLAKTDSRIDN